MSRSDYVPKWLCPETATSRNGYVPKRPAPDNTGITHVMSSRLERLRKKAFKFKEYVVGSGYVSGTQKHFNIFVRRRVAEYSAHLT